MLKKLYETRKIDYFLIRISSNNLHSKYVFEKMGAIKIGEEEADFSRFVEIFRETAEKAGQDLEEYRYLFGESADEKVYRYRLDSNTFL